MPAALTVTLLLITAVGGCSDIYVRDGITSGNRFAVSARHLMSEDPVVQSWVSYSITKSLCQLELEANNPARANSYGCELSSRIALLDEYTLQKNNRSELADDYLDDLTRVRNEAFLDEYVVHYFGRKNWDVPAEVDMTAFSNFRHQHLGSHKPQTRITGSWSYSGVGREALR